MFRHHVPPEADGIIRIMMECAADPRPEKIDLGVGVYRDPEGVTPVFEAVKLAEQRLVETQQSKGYVGLAGDPDYHDASIGLVLGDSVARERIAAIATPGGTGAVRQVFELVRMIRPGTPVWVPAPTWPNHVAILETLDLSRPAYRYYDASSGAVDVEGMLADLTGVAPGDVVLLHGSCHNPTGADLSDDDWDRVADVLSDRGAVPMIDIAYQGYGRGIEEDVAGLRRLVSRLPESLLTVSASKNFGLYRDRAGCALAICETPAQRNAVQSTLAWLNRQSFAFPPDHGARIVTMILSDPDLRRVWAAELDGMRTRVDTLRAALADALRAETGSDRFGYLRANRGMFSLIGATPVQAETLRRDHALYIIDDGRINLAGLTPDRVGPAARAIAQVLT